MNASDFNRGMTVYTQDDEELGEVHEVWAAAPSHTFKPVLQSLIYGPTAGNEELVTARDGYLQVRKGSSARPGGHDFYIPFTVIRQIDSFTSITLRVTAQACVTRFGAIEPDLHTAA